MKLPKLYRMGEGLTQSVLGGARLTHGNDTIVRYTY